MKLSIIIPAYNEAKRLPSTLTAVQAFVHLHYPETEIIVVDDGSTDATADVARQFEGVRLIRHDRNLGKGAAVRTGMIAATGDWRYLCDADLSTPIEDFERLFEFREQADVIIGSRRVPGAQIEQSQSGWKNALGRFGNLLIQLLVAPGIHDTQCGFKLYHQRTMKIFQYQRNQRFGYDFEDIFLARRFGFRLREVPVRWRNDTRSRVRLVDYPITFAEILKIHANRWRGLYPKT